MGFMPLKGRASASKSSKQVHLTAQWRNPATLQIVRTFATELDALVLVQAVQSWIADLVAEEFGPCAITFEPTEGELED